MKSSYELEQDLRDARAWEASQKKREKLDARNKRRQEKNWQIEKARRKAAVEAALRPYLAPDVLIEYDPENEGSIVFYHMDARPSFSISASGDDMTSLTLSSSDDSINKTLP